MCGIVYSKSFNNKDVTKEVLQRFEFQRNRGTTSFGFYIPERDQLTHNIKESRIKRLLRRDKGKNHEILFHHRLSTSTADVRSACHPFSTKDFFENNYVGVHNGMIFNDSELEKEQSKLGINYVSRQPDGRFNDSEALIYDIARYLEGEKEDITASGTIAFVIIKRDSNGKPRTLFFGRNTGNPLVMQKDKDGITLSSLGKGEIVEPNRLYSYDYETGKLDKRYMNIPQSYRSYSTPYVSGYKKTVPDYTPAKSASTVKRFTDDWLMYHKSGTTKEIYDVKSGFLLRVGTVFQIRDSISRDAKHNNEKAADIAMVEASMAEKELTRLTDLIMLSKSNEQYESYSHRWTVINEYMKELLKMAEDFEVEHFYDEFNTPPDGITEGDRQLAIAV